MKFKEVFRDPAAFQAVVGPIVLFICALLLGLGLRH